VEAIRRQSQRYIIVHDILARERERGLVDGRPEDAAAAAAQRAASDAQRHVSGKLGKAFTAKEEVAITELGTMFAKIADAADRKEYRYSSEPVDILGSGLEALRTFDDDLLQTAAADAAAEAALKARVAAWKAADPASRGPKPKKQPSVARSWLRRAQDGLAKPLDGRLYRGARAGA